MKPVNKTSGQLLASAWKYPWLSAFVDKQSGLFFCAGSLISSKHILSGQSLFRENLNDGLNLFTQYYNHQLPIASIIRARQKPSQKKFWRFLVNQI